MAEEQSFLLQKIILVFVFIGTIFTSLYNITLHKEEADERKKSKIFITYVYNRYIYGIVF
ncbi:hypothetical protein [Bacillus sp. TH50]|uniref:hypothetical protein n=1 Tax=Bacillus sp. TH50 TaxID=2796414 RepID=UPI001F5B9C27|nr:hypothetical protein [Bacillus sp. TH50]